MSCQGGDMSIDLSQFKQTFLEESEEGLEVLESGLLALDSGTADDDVIHAVFRAAHSIKGGSGTFGLNEISDFTHIMETLLDEMRDGRREVSQKLINVLLGSVDVLRAMLDAARDESDIDVAQVEKAKAQLAAELNSDNSEAETVATQQEKKVVTEIDNDKIGWKIVFTPFEDMLKTGNDPLRMLTELSYLGKYEVVVDDSKLPEFYALDPECSYLSWSIYLYGEIEKEEIEEIFEWVDGECDLSIQKLSEVLPTDNADLHLKQANIHQQEQAASTTVSKVPEDNPVSITPTKRNKNKGTSDPVIANVQATVDKKTEKVKEQTKPVVNKRKSADSSSSIRVGTDKVDSLINMVGELVITQSMLSQLGEDFDETSLEKLRDGLAQLERNTRELQESVMRIRMLPISFAFQRFPRVVHDLSQKMGKKIELRLSGETTELDKTVLEKINDPLVHLIRNSLDHGIELPAERIRANKPEIGIIHLNAYHMGGNIVIKINDDGAGLNRDKLLQKAISKGLVDANDNLTDEAIYELIFHPGFSTAETLSDVSGRGVGMDVVRRNIRELGGNIDVKTEIGKGTEFTIRLPLTLAILDGQLIRLGKEIFIIPLVSIIESLPINLQYVNSIAGFSEVYQLRDEYIPLIRLSSILNIPSEFTRLDEGLLVVVEADGNKAGLFVDDLLSQQQVVIKSLESNYKRVEGISGATILGDGTVALILDVSGLVDLVRDKKQLSSVVGL